LIELAFSKKPSSDAIDVVIPVYNGAQYIRECVASVLSQTLKPYRVIVVDDGSTDNTVETVNALIESDPTVTLHRLGRNCGVSAARNVGVGLSDAPFVAFVDADDIWTPNKLALQLGVFKSGNRQIGFVHSAVFFIDEAGDRRPPGRGFSPHLLRGNVFSKLLREGNVLTGSASSVMIKRAVLDKAGGFDDQLYFGEDWDVWLRLAAISEADYTPEAVVGIRVHPSSAQHKANNGVDRYFQLMRVYSRWDGVINEDKKFGWRLNMDGLRAMLSSARSLSDVESFYQRLKTSELGFVRNLYRNKFDFFLGLVGAAIIVVCQKIVGKIKRHLRDFGWIH
jgi:glycosyltransferase involved in cell wall biosynthesis